MDSQLKLIGKRTYAVGFTEEMTLKLRRVTKVLVIQIHGQVKDFGGFK